MYYIYELTYLKTGETYIGQRKLPNGILLENDKYMGSGNFSRDYFKKHKNYNGISKRIIETILSKEEADKREKFWIAYYKSIGKAELNFAKGGEGNPMYYASEELKNVWKQNLSKTFLAFSDEKKEEIKKKKQQTWINRSEEQKISLHNKQSKSHKGKKHLKKRNLLESLGIDDFNKYVSHMREAYNNKTEEQKEEIKKKIAITKANMSKEQKEEISKKISESSSKRKWYNNGETETFALECPEGFIQGRIKREGFSKKMKEVMAGLSEEQKEKRRKKISESSSKRKWYNNGIIQTFALKCPEGFAKGMLKKI